MNISIHSSANIIRSHSNSAQNTSFLSRLESGNLLKILNSIFFALYLYVFLSNYRNYISVEWAYTGLNYYPLSISQTFFAYASVMAVGYSLPKRVDRPSTVILWLLSVLVQVPTVAITFMIGHRSPDDYFLSLTCLSAVIIISSIICRTGDRPDCKNLPSTIFNLFFSVMFLLISVVLLYLFRDYLSFSNIDEVYAQRFSVEDVGGAFTGYIKTYYLYVFSSTLFSLGLANKKVRYLSVLGFIGYIVIYMIDASKIAFVLPLVVMGFWMLVLYARGQTWLLTTGLAFLTIILDKLNGALPGLKLLTDLVLVRSIAIPGQTFAQYSDLFAARGYTWWSHVRGISSFVSAPPGFAADPDWPALGQIVGADYFGALSRVNLNANLFVGEGEAAAGAFGILIIGLLMTIWLKYFDRISQGWDTTFVILLTVPLGMGLANTHLSTLLLSFGGGFWLIFMNLYKPALNRR